MDRFRAAHPQLRLDPGLSLMLCVPPARHDTR